MFVAKIIRKFGTPKLFGSFFLGGQVEIPAQRAPIVPLLVSVGVPLGSAPPRLAKSEHCPYGITITTFPRLALQTLPDAHLVILSLFHPVFLCIMSIVSKALSSLGSVIPRKKTFLLLRCFL